jgi:hypothetical protein
MCLIFAGESIDHEKLLELVMADRIAPPWTGPSKGAWISPTRGVDPEDHVTYGLQFDTAAQFLQEGVIQMLKRCRDRAFKDYRQEAFGMIINCQTNVEEEFHYLQMIKGPVKDRSLMANDSIQCDPNVAKLASRLNASVTGPDKTIDIGDVFVTDKEADDLLRELAEEHSGCTFLPQPIEDAVAASGNLKGVKFFRAIVLSNRPRAFVEATRDYVKKCHGKRP